MGYEQGGNVQEMNNAGHSMLLNSLSEREWSRQVEAWALRGGWCGIHVRKSLTTGRGYSVLAGVHTFRNSNHDDGVGMPDWLFARPGSPLIFAELKTTTGRISLDQQRWIELINRAAPRLDAHIWRPTDELAVRDILLSAPNLVAAAAEHR